MTTEGRAEDLVDWHTHMLCGALQPPETAAGEWPGVRLTCDGYQLTLGGKFYRRIDPRTIRAEPRIADMDRTGVARQILSPPPYAAAFDGPPGELAMLATQQNHFLQSVADGAPDRFSFLGMLPFRDPAALNAEMGRLERTSAVGVCMIAHHDGWLCSLESLPLWQRIADNRWLVFVHPADTAMCECDLGTGATFGVGMPSATGRFGAKLITSNLLASIPDARVLLAHAGGTLPAMIDRINHSWTMGSGPPLAESPLATARRSIWADSVSYGRGPFELAQRTLGTDHVVFGSDYPFQAMMSADELVSIHGTEDPLILVRTNGAKLLTQLPAGAG